MHDGERIEVIFHVLFVNKWGLFEGVIQRCSSAILCIQRRTQALLILLNVQRRNENDNCNYCPLL